MEQIVMYNFKARSGNRIEAIANNPNITPNNKKLLLKYIEDHSVEVSKCRTNKIGFLLHHIGTFATKDFDKCDASDFRKIVSKINSARCTRDFKEGKEWSEWYKADARATLKIFIKWLLKDDYRDSDYSWLKTTIPNNAQKSRVQEGQILDIEEIERMIETSNSTRNKAMISVAYESACRPSELLSLRIGSIKFDRYGAVINIQQSKTTPRPIRLISSTPYLKAWLNIHPNKNDTNSPLWITDAFMRGRKTNSARRGYISVEMFNRIIQASAKRAGINKRIFTYLLRHSRITHLLGKYSDQIVKKISGHSPTSDQFSVYLHLTNKDVENAVLKENGLLKENENLRTELEKPVECWQCKTMNTSEAKICENCNFSLDMSAVAGTLEMAKKINVQIAQLMKMQAGSDEDIKKMKG